MKQHQIKTVSIILFSLLPVLAFQACKVSTFDVAPSEATSIEGSPDQVTSPPPNLPVVSYKPLPKGIFVSEGQARIVSGSSEPGNLVSAPGTEPKKCVTRNGVEECAKDGVLVSVPWNLYEVQGNEVSVAEYDILLNKLIAYIDLQLDNAEDPGNALQISLIVSDGNSVPDYVKQRCSASLGLFTFEFNNPNFTEPVISTMCLPWDPAYLEEKRKLVDAIGSNFDNRKGLAYVYFTGPCSTNGNEGHCRIDKSAYASMGYTESRMNQAYIEIMSYYYNAFPTTPITMEAHAMFRSGTDPEGLSAHVFEALWREYRSTKRVGISAWWCAERLSVDDAETYLVWNVLQEAAVESFTVCQPVAKVTGEPHRFTAFQKTNYFTNNVFSIDFGSYNGAPLGYTQADYSALTDINAKKAAENNVFNLFMSWISGTSHHAGQNENIHRFTVMEPWTADFNNSSFTESFIDNF